MEDADRSVFNQWKLITENIRNTEPTKQLQKEKRFRI
jgi:hypothetical protein